MFAHCEIMMENGTGGAEAMAMPRSSLSQTPFSDMSSTSYTPSFSGMSGARSAAARPRGPQGKQFSHRGDAESRAQHHEGEARHPHSVR